MYFIQPHLALCHMRVRYYIKTGKLKQKDDLTKDIWQAVKECGCKPRSLEGSSNSFYNKTTNWPLSSSNLSVSLKEKSTYNK